MEREREKEIYVISGMGRDVTGLISLVTSIISDAKGNIIDMEENVFHGLFSIFLTIDLTGAPVDGGKFIAKMQAVAHQSGLHIAAERQTFTPRAKSKRMMRLLLIGKDNPGIVSTATFVLANNGVNVDGARMISRGDLFAMELELDRALSPRPVPEIESSVSAEMEKVGIRCFFQTEDPYSKHARIAVFSMTGNMIAPHLLREMLNEAAPAVGENFAHLKGLGTEALKALSSGLRLSSESEDLLHTLKLMGYVVVIISSGCDPLMDPLRSYECVDHLRCDKLAMQKGTLTGGIELLARGERNKRAIIAEIARAEQVSGENIIIIGDSRPADVILGDCGISVLPDKKRILSLLSKGTIDKAGLRAVLSAFGPLP